MNYLQSNNNRYRHHFCIFAKYRINMKREILYQKIAGTIAWQIKQVYGKQARNYLLYVLSAMNMV